MSAYEESRRFVLDGLLFSLPQQEARAWIPVGDLKKLLESALAYGDCNTFLTKLLDKASEQSNGKNKAKATDMMTLYTKINNQLHGGFELDYPLENPHYGYFHGRYIVLGGLNGSGAEWGSWDEGSVTVWIHRKGAVKNENYAKSLERLPYDYTETAIHEIFHGAGENGSYSHQAMDNAAGVFEPGMNFDQAMKKHCIPPNRR